MEQNDPNTLFSIGLCKVLRKLAIFQDEKLVVWKH